MPALLAALQHYTRAWIDSARCEGHLLGQRGARQRRTIIDEATEDGMTYIVTDACVKCKYMDCVEVCPVDCFYEGENFLVIHPDECIDCGVCEPECPVDAIKADTEDAPDGKWLRVNTQYALVWPNITRKGEPPADADSFAGQTGKFEKYFSDKPGSGT